MTVTNKTAKAGTNDRRGRQAAPAPDRELYLRMFRTMALQRAVEDRMVSMYRQGELLGSLYTGHWHEAIAVGTAAALRPSDFLAPLHRDLGAHLWRGVDPREVMASFMGKATSPTGGRDGTLHYGRLDLNIYNPPSHIPDNYPVATGAAFAFKYRGSDGVALAYCGDGSTGRGDFHEALNIAAVLELPCIFIVENNQYSYSTPLRLTSKSKDLATKAIAYGMPGERVDGIDVIAVYEATGRAVARARAGEGPSLIEAVTMRMHGHAEHDPADYVPRELLAEWAKRDPIEEFAATLRELKFATDEDITAIKQEARQAAIEARAKAIADPLPEPIGLEERVYAD
ncbi:MAG: thiamine pyrophosphate-dependent dehydrogenase E1 component subunit alpha [Mycobacterium sp.]|uniref:thiamine pyrophosphate-dependent dehydrogenase E1 component subunit alpha n=1 Tax=Mycobacterium sp. TaxID=1785 RepID=UPI00262A6F66|nr:thiamine pyrophosphate-dependent dehydrogenase E1 component subunit alpha [Mycobacterium sp.]MDI3313834.1 thiamine pyrophosphate-dependent dehydrogenase E1 component subunit alpha [Mycobacterium sp.]